MIRGRFAVLAIAAAMTLPGPIAGSEPAAGAGGVAGRVRVSPLQVALTLSTSTTSIGQTAKAEAKVTNVGRTTLQAIRVELRSDGAGLAIAKAVVDIALLKPGKSTSVSWNVCGRAAGSYVLLARVTVSGGAIDSAARILSVAGGGRKSCS